MKTFNKLFIFICIQVILLVFPVSAFAEPEPYKSSNVVWSNKANSQTGNRVIALNRVTNRLSLSVDGLYYFGDVESPGFVFSKAYFDNNTSAWGRLSYSHLVSRHINMRYSLGGGFLRAENKDGSKSFDSWILNGAVGIEYFPVEKSGFYIYAGVMFNYSNLYGWQYKGDEKKGNAYLPMIPIEIGYQFTLKDNWLMDIHIGGAQGLADTDNICLDGFGNGTLGSGAKWADGWFNLGITISYGWHNSYKRGW